VLFTIADLQPESGGPSRSVPAFCTALAQHGAEVEIVAMNYGANSPRPILPMSDLVRTRFVARTRGWAKRVKWTSGFADVVREICREWKPSIVHDTGLWLLTNHAAVGVARQQGLSVVVSPRGMLSGWALRYRGWKKHLAWHLYQKRDLQRAAMLHATSYAEVESLRAAGVARPIAVVPNGVELPEDGPQTTDYKTTMTAGSSDGSEVSPVKAEGRKILLYVGRLHPIKGLPDLVRAWAELRPQGWRVVIAGGDENSHQVKIESLVRQLCVEKDFEFAGPIKGNARWDLHRSANLFVLPSYSENFGLVVAEALACGVPVITTHATPWEELRTHRCGWWVETGPAALVSALREATSLNDEARRAMGHRGRQLIEQKYTWSAAAQKMMAVYEWMLQRGPKPECVIPTGDGR